MRLVLFAAVAGVVACSAAQSTAPTTPLIEPHPGLDSLFITPGRWADVGKSCSDADRGVSVPTSRIVAYSHFSDDKWAALARTVPGGLGGYFFNQGAYTIYLVDTPKFAAAATAVSSAGYRTPTAVLRGRWDFGQMFDWAGVIWHNMPATAPVTFFDINEATNRLEFAAPDSTAFKNLDKIFASMDLPCRLVWLRNDIGAVVF